MTSTKNTFGSEVLDDLLKPDEVEQEKQFEAHRLKLQRARRSLPSDQQDLLLEIGLRLADLDSSMFETKRLAGRFLNVILEQLNCPKGGVFAKDANGAVICLFARHGAQSVQVEDFSETRIAKALDPKNARVIVAGHQRLGAGGSTVAPPSVERNLLGPMAVVPLVVPAGDSDAGRPFAALCLVRTPGERGFEEEVTFLELLAKLMSPLLYRSQVHQVAVDHIQRIEQENTNLEATNRLLRREIDRASSKGDPRFTLIIGQRSPAMKPVLEMVDLVSSDPIGPVIILGETGTGKEVITRTIHVNSKRCDKPFVARNMAVLKDPQLINDELFGHVPKAFTGADTRRAGLFLSAAGGTILLDEVAELPLETQARLLRVLQEKVIIQVGADVETPVDVRVIVATNKDLEKEVKEGRFREDLYYRIKGFVVRLPPLRERREDFPDLAEHFLKTEAAKRGTKSKGIERDALRLLMEHTWPGNVRELENTIGMLVVIAKGRKVSEDDVRMVLPSEEPGKQQKKIPKDELLRLLDKNKWNVSRALHEAGISKTYMYKLMRDYGIERPDGEQSEDEG